MLPVRLKVLPSSSCTLSEASSLLQRFLSSDACSDSLARGYVANVAQALQDSISRRAENSGRTHNKHLQFSASQLSSPFSKILLGDDDQSTASAAITKQHGRGEPAGVHSFGRQKALAAGDDGHSAGYLVMDAESAHKRQKKRRKHSSVENDTEAVTPSMPEVEDSTFIHHDKKRRKKEKKDVETEQVVKGNSTVDDQWRRIKEMGEVEVGHVVTEHLSSDSQNKRKKKKEAKKGAEEKNWGSEERVATENGIADSTKHHEKKKRKDKLEAETNSIEVTTPDLSDQICFEKKKKKKEKQGKGAENMETMHVNAFGSHFSDMKSTTKGKKKQDTSKIPELRVSDDAPFEPRVFDVPHSLNPDETAKGTKRKEREENARLFATPDKVAFTKVKEKIDAVALPVGFICLDSEEKKRKKKKKRKGHESE